MPKQHPRPTFTRFSSFPRLRILLLGILFLFLPQNESRASIGLLNLLWQAGDRVLDKIDSEDAPTGKGGRAAHANAETSEEARQKARADMEAKWREETAKRRADAVAIAGAPLVLAPDLGIPADEVSLNPTRRWIRANIVAPWVAEAKQQPDAKNYEQDIYEFENLFLHHFRGIDPPNNKISLEKRFIERAKKNPSNVWLVFVAQSFPLLRTPNSQRSNEVERYKRLRAAFDNLPSSTSAENAARRLFANQILLTYAPRANLVPSIGEKLKSWMREEFRFAAQEFFHSLDSAANYGLFRGEDGEIFLFHVITFRKQAQVVEHPLIWKKQELLSIFKTDSTSVSEWCLELMAGYIEHRHAWKEWGTGLIFKNKDLEEFARHRKVAYKHYKQADKLNPKNPIAAANLILIANQFPEVSEETPRYWFDRATSISGNYDFAYGKYAYSLRPKEDGSLLPGQGGSVEELQALLKACISIKNPDGFDRENIVREVLNAAGFSSALGVLRGHNTGSEVAVCCNHLASEERDEKRRAYLYSSAAICAWLSADYKNARIALEGANWKVGENVFGDFLPENYAGGKDVWIFRYFHALRIVGDVAVLTEPGAVSYAKGKEVLLNQKYDHEKAAELFAEAAKQSTSEHARNWAEAMRITACAAAQLEKAGSVDLVAKEYRGAWLTAHSDFVQTIGENALQVNVQTRDSDYENAWFNPQFPLPEDNFEVVAKIKPLNNFQSSAYIALMLRSNFSTKWSSAPTIREFYARVDWYKKILAYSTIKTDVNPGNRYEMTTHTVEVKNIPPTEIIELRMEVRDGKGRTWINGALSNEGAFPNRSQWDIPVLLFASWEKSRKFEILEYTVRKL